MRFLILLLMSLSLISCGRGDRIPRGVELNDGSTTLNVDAEINVLIYNRGGYGRRDIKPRCRGINGCLSVCEHFDNSKCKQLSADKVIQVWLEEIKSYDAEQAMKDLTLIVTEPKIADLLKNLDAENYVVQSLFALSQSADCPFSSVHKISYSYNPSVNLYLSHVFQEDHPLVMAKSEAEAGLESFTNLEAERTHLDSFTAEALAKAEEDANAAAEKLGTAQAAAEAAAQAETGAGEAFNNTVQAEQEAAQAALDAADDAGKSAAQEALDAAVTAKSQAEEALNAAKAENEIAKGNLERATEMNTQAQKLLGDTQAIASEGTTNIENLGQDKLKWQEALDTATSNLEVAEKEVEGETKKIIDGSILSFDLPVFRGFVKQCFGYKRPRAFSEVAVEIQNKSAFEIGHQVLFKACGGNSECVRLAYCAIDSDMVWPYVKEDIKAPGCGYDEFVEMLP